MKQSSPPQIVQDILPKGRWDILAASDSIVLDYDERHRRRFSYSAEGGTSFLLDLPRPRLLEDGDGLLLADGAIVRVRAANEHLMEVDAADAEAMLQLAWHIGNRHLPAQIAGKIIRLRRDHVIRDMLIGLGARVTDVLAPFSPERGAYATASAAHHHPHQDHEHDDHAA